MNNFSMLGADRMTHLKVVAMALVCATLVAGIGVAARVTDGAGDGRVEVTVVKATEHGGSFKVAGSVNDTPALSGRIEMAYFNLGEKHESLAYLDEKVMRQTKERWEALMQGNEEVAGHLSLTSDK